MARAARIPALEKNNPSVAGPQGRHQIGSTDQRRDVEIFLARPEPSTHGISWTRGHSKDINAPLFSTPQDHADQ
jgi:hypothetical protein